MGWYDKDFKGEEIGRLLINTPTTRAGDWEGHCARLLNGCRNHEKAYLTSQTTSWKAINMYLDFGFRPLYTFELSKT